MSDQHSPVDTKSSRKPDEHDDERIESVNDRIDRINRNAFQRIICRRLSDHAEHANH